MISFPIENIIFPDILQGVLEEGGSKATPFEAPLEALAMRHLEASAPHSGSAWEA
jgi:hypothetical protein